MAALSRDQILNTSSYSKTWDDTILNQISNHSFGWGVPQAEREQYGIEFVLYSRYNTRPLTRVLFAEMYRRQRRLNISYESQAFELADYDRKNYLDLYGYIIACHLLSRFSRMAMPRSLPSELFPYSKPLYHLSKAQDVAELAERRNAFTTTSTINCSERLRPYVNLSNEVWSMIFSYLPPSGLKASCRVSKRFHSLSILFLYRNINLKEVEFRYFHDNTDQYAHLSPSLPQAHLIIQQYRLRRLLLRNKQYASLVRVFSWSMSTRPQRDLNLPYWIDDEEVMNHDGLDIQLFQILQNVTTLDLDISIPYVSADHRYPSLFPNASTITLCGFAPKTFINCILSGKGKAPLKSLNLSTIFQSNDMVASQVPNRLYGLWRNAAGTFLPGPGNMIKHLSSPDLLSRCENLQVLRLSKIGACDPNDREANRLRHILEREKRVYQAWSDFLKTVRPKILFLKQEQRGFSSRVLPQPALYPMNLLFKSHVLPVLMEGWEGLEEVNLTGVEIPNGESELLARAVRVNADQTVNVCPAFFDGRTWRKRERERSTSTQQY